MVPFGAKYNTLYSPRMHWRMCLATTRKKEEKIVLLQRQYSSHHSRRSYLSITSLKYVIPQMRATSFASD